MKPYRLVEDFLKPVLRFHMPRALRLHVPGGTVRVMARCNNRECAFTMAEDFQVLLARLGVMRRTYAVTLYVYTLMSNHLHLPLQAPTREALGRPLCANRPSGLA